MSTLATVQRIIADQTGLSISELLPARLLEELGVDSLTVIESMFLIEDEFGIVMPGTQSPIRTVRDIADVVDRLLLQQESERSGPL